MKFFYFRSPQLLQRYSISTSKWHQNKIHLSTAERVLPMRAVVSRRYSETTTLTVLTGSVFLVAVAPG